MNRKEVMIKAAEEIEVLEKTAAELREENEQLKKQIADTEHESRCVKIAQSMADSGMISEDEVIAQSKVLKSMSGDELAIEERAIELSGHPKVASLSRDTQDSSTDPREKFYQEWNQ
jgi:cell division protein FtsB